jgi:NodT family efflux transporter outer membrane factor (OMF) lipoprotein
VAVVLGGCAAVPPPPADLASRHVGAPDAFSELARGSSATADGVGAGWLADFNDPLLESLVREAWDSNPDLYATAARFEEAAANLRVAASFLSPQVAGLAGVQLAYDDGSIDDDRYALGLGASWEVDLWGRLRSDRAAAAAIADSAGLDFLQARHSLAAAVAEAYYAIVTGKQQLAIDRQLLDAERFTAVTTGQRVQAGLGTTLDEDLAESSVRLAEAAVQDDLASLRASRRALELLLGRYPSAELDAAPDALPRVSALPVAVGVPSTLLERRPDVRSAERVVDATYYDVRSARAARLPRLTLSADATTLLDPAAFVTSVAADIVAPIFEGGRLRAQEAAADARQRRALGAFASVALRAFREVEGALSNARSLDLREAQLAEASERLQRAGDAAIGRYEQGLLTILDLQQIRRQDFETRSLLLGVRFEQVRQRLDLALALGGPVSADQPDTAPDPAAAPITGDLRVGVPTEPATEQDNDR